MGSSGSVFDKLSTEASELVFERVEKLLNYFLNSFRESF